MTDSSNSRRRAVLFVVTALVVIGSIWGWRASAHWRADRPVRQFNAEVDNLFEAFHQFKSHVGSYPEGGNADIAKALLQGNNSKKVIILAVKKSELNAKGEIVDPWGTPLKIYFAQNEVLIRSAGANKTFEDSKAGVSDDYFRSD